MIALSALLTGEALKPNALSFEALFRQCFCSRTSGCGLFSSGHGTLDYLMVVKAVLCNWRRYVTEKHSSP